jgi:PAS domain S-box-containing protein
MITPNRRRELSLNRLAVQQCGRRIAVYTLAVALTILMLFIRNRLSVSFGERPLLILFMFPVIISALLGGFGPGLAATLTAAACTAYLIPPAHSFAIAAGYDLFQWGMLIANGVLVSFLSAFRSRSQQRETARQLRLIAAQDQLQQSEARFQATFEQAAAGIALLTPDGRWLRVNHKLCEIVGYSQDDLRALTFQDITHPDDLAVDLDYVSRMLAGEIQSYRMEKRYLRKDGSAIWINLTVALIRKPDSTPDYFVAVIEDIQARKQAEESLCESAQRLRLALDAARAGAWEWNVETEENFWSEELWPLYGLAPHSVQPSYEVWRQTVHPDDLPTVEQAVQEAVLARREFEIEWRVNDSSVSPRWLLSRGRPVRDADGRVARYLGIVIDISERRQAEQEALIGKSKLEAALASMTDAVLISDDEGRFLDFNEAFATIHRFNSKQECAKTLAEYPEILDVFMADGRLAPLEQWAIPRALRGEIVTNAEYTLRRKDTGETWIGSYSFAPIRDRDGVIIGSVVTGRDITERKQIEIALRESEERFRTFMAHNPAAAWIVDDEGRFRYVSPGYYRMFGVPGDLTGRTIGEIYPAALAEEYLRNNRLAIAEDRAVETVESGVCADGSPGRFLVIKFPIHALNGETLLGGEALDITAMKQAEARLRESEERLQLFIEHAPAALAMFDREMRYIGVSRRWMNDYSLGDRKIIGQSHYEVFPEIPERLKAIHQRGLAGEVIQANDDAFIRLDGVVQWLRWVMRPWHAADGAIGGIVIFSEDITEQRHAETEIHRLNVELEERVRQRTAELVAANQELDSFAYAVSHDLRAPLRAMSGFSQALLEDYGARLDGEARVYLDQIIISSHRMNDLVDGLLVLSRSTRGGLRLELVDLSAMAKRLLAERSAAEPERQVVRQVESAMRVQGDPLMLEVVMRNLIENAWKYTAKTPNATIRVYTDDHQDSERCFCVTDNGAGFDMSHSNRLFQAFQRLHRQDEFPGIGIGLATVQRIIHRHGGVIRAEGAPGCGATFRFTLPGVGLPHEETA